MDISPQRLMQYAACCAGALPLQVWAQSAATPPLAASVLQLVLGLAFVIVLILGSLWLLKRIASRSGAGSGLLQVVAGVAVGPRERVVLVEIGETWLVLGVAPGQVRTLHQLPRELCRAETPNHDNDALTATRDFRGWLEHALERKHAPR